MADSIKVDLATKEAFRLEMIMPDVLVPPLSLGQSSQQYCSEQRISAKVIVKKKYKSNTKPQCLTLIGFYVLEDQICQRYDIMGKLINKGTVISKSQSPQK
jgi:hypothetical protein